MTFRLEPELADVLRGLPNQTRFVESALKEALGHECPACGGTGRIVGGSLRVSDFREAALPRLERDAAAPLRELVRLGKRVLATSLELEADPDDRHLGFRIARDDRTLLSGRLDPTSGDLRLH
jgi:hypothetical protein